MKKYLCDKKVRSFYKRNGYFVARSVLSSKECSVLIKEAHKICKIETVTSNIYRKSKKYLNLLKDKRILSLADSLLQWRVIPIGDIFFFQSPRTQKKAALCPIKIIMRKEQNTEPIWPLGFI